MEPTTNSASGKIITALIIGLLVGFAMGVFWQSRRGGFAEVKTKDAAGLTGATLASTTSEKGTAVKDTKGSETDKSVKVDASLPSDSAISVDEQTAGSSVVVREVTTPRSVWVAVREQREGGLGNILGVQKIGPGKNTNVVVTLLRPTIDKSHYYVVLHSDSGDSAFNVKEDTLVPNLLAEFVALK